jgi:hypothetical protein
LSSESQSYQNPSKKKKNKTKNKLWVHGSSGRGPEFKLKYPHGYMERPWLQVLEFGEFCSQTSTGSSCLICLSWASPLPLTARVAPSSPVGPLDVGCGMPGPSQACQAQGGLLTDQETG